MPDVVQTDTTLEPKRGPGRPPLPRLPSKVRMLSPYGFIDENNRHRYWHEGDVVGDASEIRLLTDRKAPIEPMD